MKLLKKYLRLFAFICGLKKSWRLCGDTKKRRRSLQMAPFLFELTAAV
jgi:hypothetical protein